MKLVNCVFAGLLLVAGVASVPDGQHYFNDMPVCGSFYDLTKTFTNVLEFSQEFISSGKVWKFIKLGPCPPVSECKVYNPVCGVSPANVYHTFLNECLLDADRKMTGTGWQIISPGICSANPSQLSPSAASFSSSARSFDIAPPNEQNSLSLASAKAVLKYIAALSKTVKDASAQPEGETKPADSSSEAESTTELTTTTSPVEPSSDDSQSPKDASTSAPLTDPNTLPTSNSAGSNQFSVSSSNNQPQQTWASFIMPIRTTMRTTETNDRSSSLPHISMGLDNPSTSFGIIPRQSLPPADVYDKISQLYFGVSPFQRRSISVKRHGQIPLESPSNPVKRQASYTVSAPTPVSAPATVSAPALASAPAPVSAPAPDSAPAPVSAPYPVSAPAPVSAPLAFGISLIYPTGAAAPNPGPYAGQIRSYWPGSGSAASAATGPYTQLIQIVSASGAKAPVVQSHSNYQVQSSNSTYYANGQNMTSQTYNITLTPPSGSNVTTTPMTNMTAIPVPLYPVNYKPYGGSFSYGSTYNPSAYYPTAYPTTIKYNQVQPYYTGYPLNYPSYPVQQPFYGAYPAHRPSYGSYAGASSGYASASASPAQQSYYSGYPTVFAEPPVYTYPAAPNTLFYC